MTSTSRFSGLLFQQLLLVLSLLAVPAGSPASPGDEIRHLLTYIESSGCTFIRNGKEYGSTDALEHIRMKYEYLGKKVETAEDFIEYAATKSSLSGKPYLVRCGEEEALTARWLTEELARFRQPGNEPGK